MLFGPNDEINVIVNEFGIYLEAKGRSNKGNMNNSLIYGKGSPGLYLYRDREIGRNDGAYFKCERSKRGKNPLRISLRAPMYLDHGADSKREKILNRNEKLELNYMLRCKVRGTNKILWQVFVDMYTEENKHLPNFESKWKINYDLINPINSVPDYMELPE